MSSVRIGNGEKGKDLLENLYIKYYLTYPIQYLQYHHHHLSLSSFFILNKHQRFFRIVFLVGGLPPTPNNQIITEPSVSISSNHQIIKYGLGLPLKKKRGQG
jgi:hypothetical protein